jgi:3-oxo-5-alpha-steroid 4-dehydrogenase 3
VEHYGVPRGGWFERISCAHYTAEVVLYVGVACAASATCPPACATGALPWLLVAAVTGNLGFSARATHAWYLQHLPNYPRDRWAFIPWVC